MYRNNSESNMSIKMQAIVVVLIQTLLLLTEVVVSWTPSPNAKHLFTLSKVDNAATSSFGNGNITNYFKVLDQDDYSILVGAR